MKNKLHYILDLLRKEKDLKNSLFYLWKRNNWMLNPLNYLRTFKKIDIKSPIFLIGNQGNGLTLISRILRRNKEIVNITGNSKYWAGADEMALVYENILTSDISGISINTPYDDKLPSPRGWSYACDNLLPYYRKTKENISEKNKKKFIRSIKMSLNRNAKKVENPRFLDKSQVFTVKLSFINEIIKEYAPFFIHITRNPYAMIYRAALGIPVDMKRASKFLNFSEKLDIVSEHWLNSVKAVEEDKKHIQNFKTIKFEDFLQNPEEQIKGLCNFVKINYTNNMLPKKQHKLPIGTKDRMKWYPINPHINKKYLDEIPVDVCKKIHLKIGNYAEKYNYFPPK